MLAVNTKVNDRLTYKMERNDQKIFLIATYINLIAESDESSNDDSDSAILNLLVKNKVKRVPKVRCQNYVENVVWHYTGNAFKNHFR